MSALNQLNIGVNSQNRNDMFRATKVWNEVLHAFYIGISLKKHRKHMRSHSECFIASEAVDWLTSYLQISPHFANQNISRFQALNLLRKYLKANIIEKVNAKKANYEFQDNKDLYRFTKHANENLPFITTSNSSHEIDSTPKLTRSVIKKPVVLPELTLTEKSQVYKQIFFQRCKSLIPSIGDLVRRDEVISLFLMHNLTRISANGVVQLTDKSEDLPHWVMSAMKCLANWPKASGSGSCLPKYPGFENDVFAVVRDYFVNIGIPLIPNQLYPLMIAVYDFYIVEPKNPNNLNFQPSNSKAKLSPILLDMEKLKRQAMSANELMTSTPILENQISTTAELPPNHVFETFFTGEVPITKIVSIDELTNLFKMDHRIKRCHSFSNRANSIHKTPSTGKIDRLCTDHNLNEKSRYFEAVTTIPRKSNKLKSPIATNIYKTKYESPESLDSDSSGIGYYNFGFAMQSPTEDGEYMLSKSVSSLSSIHMSAKSHNDEKDNLSAQFTKSSNNSSQSSKSNLKTVINTTDRNDAKLVEALQWSLFLMPPSNRRHLHLLLRLLSKLIYNQEINLFVSQHASLKDYILNTFTRSVLCAAKESFYDELKSQKIVCVLLDNCKDIFKVPEDLIKEVECQLVEKRKQKYLDENSQKPSLQYCEQITTDEFELQRDVLSEYALADLLRSIMTDDKLTDREKLKWIKQFKLHHPNVYELYFTNQVKSSNEQKDDTPKTSSLNVRSQNSNLLKRFLSIRL